MSINHLLALAWVALLCCDTSTRAQSMGVPTNGLLAHFSLDGHIADQSGHGHSGTIYGAKPATDRYGKSGGAFHFNGATDYITTTLRPRGTQSITMALWFSTTAKLDDAFMLSARGAYATGIGINSVDTLFGTFGTPSGFHNVDYVTARVIDGRWHSVVVTYDGQEKRLYLDGFLESAGKELFILDPDKSFEIGRDSLWGGIRYFEGRIDDVRVYDRALSAAEVSGLYGIEKVTHAIRVPADYPTIQQAVNAASDGDVVSIEDGLYTESVRINKRISVRGGGKRFGTVIDAAWAASAITVDGTTVEIENLVLQNGRSGLVVQYCNQPVIRHCLVRSNLVDGIVTTRSAGVRIEDCIIEGNAGKGVHSVADTLLISRTLVRRNGHGVYNHESNEWRIHDSVLSENGEAIRVWGTILSVVNSTITGNEIPMVYMESELVFVTNSIVFGNRNPRVRVIGNPSLLSVSSSYYEGGEGGIQIGPGGRLVWGHGNIDGTNSPFVSASTGDYRLHDDSKAIDAGDNSVIDVAGWKDRDGRSRVLGGRVDMGAHERWVLYPERRITVLEGESGYLEINSELPAEGAQPVFSIQAPVLDGVAIDRFAGRLTWSPTEAQGPGDYLIVVVAEDEVNPKLWDTQLIHLRSEEVNRSPILQSVTSQEANEGVFWSMELSATDPDIPHNTLVYSIVEGPPGLTVNPSSGLVSWTPGETDGGRSFDVVVNVTDDGTPPLSARSTFRLDVRKVNSPPSLQSLPNLPIVEQEAWSAQLAGRDSDLPAQELRYSLESAPEGMELDAVSGLITWEPSEAQGPGTFAVRVRVTDPDGLFAEQAFELTVVEANQLPVPEIPSARRIVYGQGLSFLLRGMDADQPPNLLSFRLASGPSGLKIASNGAASWSPVRGQAPSTNAITAIVSDGMADVPFTFEIEVLDLITSINGQEATNLVRTVAPGAVAISSSRTNWPIHFTLDGSEPTRWSTLYTRPFDLAESATVWPIQFSPGYEASVLGVPVQFKALRPQVLTFSGGEGLRFQGAPVAVHATASSGLPVQIEVVEGPARVDEGMLVALGGGTVRLRLQQPGDEFWAPVSLDVERIIARAPQTITWGISEIARLVDGEVVLRASASSGLPVSFLVVDGPATVAGAVLRLSAAGIVRLRASQPGDTNFEAATAELTIRVLAPPTITLQPVNQTAAPGGSVSFSIEAIGTDPIAIQWWRNGVMLPGATGPTLTFRDLKPDDAGLVIAIVSDAGGSVSSSPATLEVAQLPTITRQPVDQTIQAGQRAEISVAASGTGPLAYQWRRNGRNLACATEATLVLAEVTPGDEGRYDVVVSSPYGTQASRSAQITVLIKAPVIVSQPQGVITNAGSRVVLGVVATGVPPLSYQWQLWGDAINGATNALLVFASIEPADAGTYKVTVFDRYTNSISLGASLIVTAAPPVITHHPTNLSVDAGSPATLAATATGIEPLTFQWLHNGVPVANATGASYTISSTSPTHSGVYRVIVRDRYGEVISQGAVLTVRWAAPAIVIEPMSQTGIEDGEVIFNAEASGIPRPSLQWRQDGVDIPGQTGPVLRLLDLTLGDAGGYQLVASNSFGQAVSGTAVLTVNPVLSLGEALDAPSYFFRSSGAAPWVLQPVGSADSQDVAVSGDITDGQSTWIETRVNGPGSLSFWWKVSSEMGFDRLNFMVGGREVTNLTGEVGWRQHTTAVPAGPQMLRWEYRKDGSGSAGQDRAWLDQFVFNSTVDQPVALALPRFRDRDGRFQFRFVGQPGRVWNLESSADLLKWEPVHGFTNNSPRQVILDPYPPASGHRVYRVVPVE